MLRVLEGSCCVGGGLAKGDDDDADDNDNDNEVEEESGNSNRTVVYLPPLARRSSRQS